MDLPSFDKNNNLQPQHFKRGWKEMPAFTIIFSHMKQKILTDLFFNFYFLFFITYMLTQLKAEK